MNDNKNALIAIVLSGLILFGWQYFFVPKQPASAPIEPVNSLPEKNTQISAQLENTSAPIEPVSKESFELASVRNKAQVNNSLSVTSFDHHLSVFSFQDIAGKNAPLDIEFSIAGLPYQVLDFKTLKSTKTLWEGVNENFNLKASASFADGETIKFSVSSPKDFLYRIKFKGEPKKLENGQERKFAFYSDELETFAIDDDENGDKKIEWAGVDFNYHLFGFYFEKPKNLLFQVKPDGKFQVFSSTATKSLEYNVFFFKKEYNYLDSLGHNLKNSVDFGFFGFFAVWILKGLQFFYKFFPNYGVSIILLTFLIRMITFPLQYKSFASMKKMQLVQPELGKIREKYKDDPMRLQKESMALFKKSGANPLGGCLPLILQMPVFFAFYKVLYSAVELVNAPFIFWIHDLSNKDPYYVLPVLVSGAMFLQQKVSPQTISDPVQKKVFLFMPLIFGLIMKDLPSGLSLYIFTSTLLGIGQQFLVFKIQDRSPVVV